MSTLLISILYLSASTTQTQNITQSFTSYGECLRAKQIQESVLSQMSEESILGYSIKCK